MGRFVAYYRVSTQQQGRSGLGLAAQREAVLGYVGKGDLLAEFTEVESASYNKRRRSRKPRRPQLDAALRHCRATGATLVVAKLDRLARDLEFVTNVMNSGVEFIAVDFPAANRLMIQVLAAFAEYESRCTSERTTAALQAAKARGQRMGNPNGAAAPRRAAVTNVEAVHFVRDDAQERAKALADMVRDIRKGGVTSLPGIAAELTKRGAKTARGGRWHPSSVSRLLARVDGMTVK